MEVDDHRKSGALTVWYVGNDELDHELHAKDEVLEGNQEGKLGRNDLPVECGLASISISVTKIAGEIIDDKRRTSIIFNMRRRITSSHVMGHKLKIKVATTKKTKHTHKKKSVLAAKV
jgi:hypothetical protein